MLKISKRTIQKKRDWNVKWDNRINDLFLIGWVAPGTSHFIIFLFNVMHDPWKWFKKDTCGSDSLLLFCIEISARIRFLSTSKCQVAGRTLEKISSWRSKLIQKSLNWRCAEIVKRTWFWGIFVLFSLNQFKFSVDCVLVISQKCFL